MRTKQRADKACGRRAVLAELGIGDAPEDAGGTSLETSRYSCRCAECADAQWDIQRLKYWLCARLLALGAEEAEVDRRVGELPVDIYYRVGAREYAVEVRSGSLDRAKAVDHTQRLRAAGLEGVLWLCQPGYWVAHLPAVGIANFAPPACDYLIESGMLTSDGSALAAPRPEAFELRDFLEGFLSGEIVWGYRDELTGGFGTVTDWTHHTHAQAMVIARQRQELVNQRTALALSRKTVRDKQKQIMKLTSRLERTELDAEGQADSLAQMNRKLADHHRVDASLRTTIKGLQETISHWQLVTYCSMMLIVTFVAGAMVVR
ncbi:hypothetical protein AB0H76_06900 [Nocardia sp. NPDC050712]|uniref:hypothetical protein n=1 Tax=Nocardia sp. NPDC050712 TaxID=3155518 RepID=UPI0033FF3624